MKFKDKVLITTGAFKGQIGVVMGIASMRTFLAMKVELPGQYPWSGPELWQIAYDNLEVIKSK